MWSHTVWHSPDPKEHTVVAFADKWTESPKLSWTSLALEQMLGLLCWWQPGPGSEKPLLEVDLGLLCNIGVSRTLPDSQLENCEGRYEVDWWHLPPPLGPTDAMEKLQSRPPWYQFDSSRKGVSSIGLSASSPFLIRKGDSKVHWRRISKNDCKLLRGDKMRVYTFLITPGLKLILIYYQQYQPLICHFSNLCPANRHDPGQVR